MLVWKNNTGCSCEEGQLWGTAFTQEAQEAQHDPQLSRTVASGPRSQGCCDLSEPQWLLSGTSRVTAMGILEAHGDTMWSQDSSRVESGARSILALPSVSGPLF